MTINFILLIGIIFLFFYSFYFYKKIIKKERTLDEYISLFICNNIDKIIENKALNKLIEKHSIKKLKELKEKVDIIHQENEIYKQEILKLNTKLDELYEIISELTDEKIKLKQENKKLQINF